MDRKGKSSFVGRPCLASAGPRPSLKAAAPAQAGLAGFQPAVVGIASRQKVSSKELGQCASLHRATALPLACVSTHLGLEASE